MTVAAEKVTLHDVLALTRYLSAADRKRLVELLNQQGEEELEREGILSPVLPLFANTEIDSPRIETKRIQI